ncbi:MAG: exosortase/archaeosortase family protein [Sedimentisphaerales bacterium]|nr:exosortase/archaeosortase family protein [Sedimentisphaerales bacterium]
MAENIVFSDQETPPSRGLASPHANWSDLNVHSYIKILIIGGLFFWLFHSEIETIVRRWVTDSSWSHGFLIPFFSLYFVNQRKHNILNVRTRPNWLGLFLLICVILFYPLNIVQFQYGYFRPLCMIPALCAIVLFLGGWRLLKYTWLPIFFLIFAIPLPQRYYVQLTMPMRLLAADVSSAVLNLVKGLEATANGVVIDITYQGQQLEPSLNVAEACSGMRLLMAFLALGVAMAYLHYRPIWQRAVLLGSTIPIAILCNIIRVTVTGFIYVLIHPKYTQGIYHDMLGLVMLPLAFAIYGFIAWFMASLFIEQTESKLPNVIVRKRLRHQ